MTRPPLASYASIGLIGLFASGDAVAAPTPSAAEAGAGGATVANPRDNSSIVTNPSLLGLTPRYDAQAQFVGGPTKEIRWNASIVDGRTSDALAFGVAYHGGIVTPRFFVDELPGWGPADEELVNKKQMHDITVALAAPFLENRLSVGLNGTLSFFNGDYVGKGVTGNLDVGLSGRPHELVTLGVVARDILPIVDQGDTPAAVVVGMRAGKEDLITGSLDAGVRVEQVTGSRFDLAAGIHGTIKKVVDLRTGWDWNGDTNLHRIAWGFGLHSRTGSVSYAMQLPVNLKPWVFSEVTHSVSLTIYTNFGNRQAEDEPVRWPSER